MAAAGAAGLATTAVAVAFLHQRELFLLRHLVGGRAAGVDTPALPPGH